MLIQLDPPREFRQVKSSLPPALWKHSENRNIDRTLSVADNRQQTHSRHLCLLVATGSILRVRDVLLQYVPQTLHQALLVCLHFLDFHLGVLQHT